jgi:CubicO group peptidase (beta-lactamase class C family)
LRRAAAALLGLMATYAAAAGAQAVPGDSAIRSILADRVGTHGDIGIIVGITDSGRTHFVAVGSAGAGSPSLDAHTILEIGSISKTFTSLLLAGDVIRGDVRLNEAVADLLPTGTVVPSSHGTQITLEELATHRSGLPRLPTNLAPVDSADPYADYDAKKLYGFLASYTLPRAPGDSAEYSNLGAGLLGYALTRRAGAPSWAALVRQRILNPLHMRETFVEVPASVRRRVAAGHDATLRRVPAWRWDVLAGAGALRSTAADMLTYLQAALDTVNGPLHAEFSLAERPRAVFSPGARIGLAWLLSGPPAHPIYWHDGGTGGFASFAAFDPSRQLGVVVLTNSARAVADIGLHLMNASIPLATPIVAPATRVELPDSALDRLVGDYALAPTVSLVITRKGNTLFGQATGQSAFPLTATAPDRFVFPAAGIEIRFDISTPGPAERLTLIQGGNSIVATRKKETDHSIR